MKYWLIIPAAGVGKRMQSVIPKQYLMLNSAKQLAIDNNKTIIEQTVSVFNQIDAISKIVIALSPDDQLGRQLFVNQPAVEIVNGGAERFHSVFNALTALKSIADDQDWVLVHDAVRPFVTKEDIERLFAQLNDHPVGGILATPITQTLKRINQYDEIVTTVDRDNLWQAQTPQMFRYAILTEAIAKVLKNKIVITDDAQAVEYLGYQAKIVAGNPANIKITYPQDLHTLE